jgi:hypothetical protein
MAKSLHTNDSQQTLLDSWSDSDNSVGDYELTDILLNNDEMNNSNRDKDFE